MVKQLFKRKDKEMLQSNNIIILISIKYKFVMILWKILFFNQVMNHNLITPFLITILTMKKKRIKIAILLIMNKKVLLN